MRLLHTTTLQLSEFWGDEIPRYAILSHTWEEDEATFLEVVSGEETTKKGFLKVLRCCEEARKDGFDYAWIDTCCIDKSSSAELSEAINSMFQWYRKAEVCYAYLSDVSEHSSPVFPFAQMHASRWFTRGWTLQELLAPREVMFFSHDWKRIGNRQRWASDISLHMFIHEEALRGDIKAILAFSAAQKFSWISRRSTTREEDIAYCMLGLFDVHMPLLYGEGQQAFIRLQEEIMKKSDDQSIFAWSEDEPTTEICGLLAPSPERFFLCGTIAPFRNWKRSEPYEMTNAGLRMRSSLVQGPDSYDPALILQCYNENAPERLLGVPLRKLTDGGDQYARKAGSMEYFMGNDCTIMPTRTIYIRNNIIMPNVHEVETAGMFIAFQVSAYEDSIPFTIKDSWPRGQWDPSRSLILRPTWSEDSNQETDQVAPNPALFNWSWHVVLLIRLERGEDSTSPAFDEDIFVLIGYNGRNDKCWVDARLDTELEVAWKKGYFSNSSKYTSDWILEKDGNEVDELLSIRMEMETSEGDPLPLSTTNSWTGEPIRVKVGFKVRAR